jgi:chemotaxis protein CheD
MYKRYSENFKRNMVIIYPGEFYVSTSDIIATVLGSCIAVCIKDRKTGIGGMNHFMLPGDVRSQDMFLSASAKYGMFAMEQLLNEMIKHNGSKKDFEAKVFGGGHVLNFRKTDGNVPESNIEFVKAFLTMEQIPVVKQDVGGYAGRKILFFPDTAKVLLKRLETTVDSKIIQAEQSYKTKLFKDKEKLQETGGDLTLF